MTRELPGRRIAYHFFFLANMAVAFQMVLQLALVGLAVISANAAIPTPVMQTEAGPIVGTVDEKTGVASTYLSTSG